METENKDSDSVKQLQKTAKHISKQFKFSPELIKIAQELHEILKVESERGEKLKKIIQSSIGPNFEKLSKEIPDQSKQVYLELAERGWFLDLDLTLREALQLTSGTAKEVEEKLIERFNSRLSKIEQSITEEYPERKKIIEAAFNAHHREEYELSIPVLLAQADGICKEKIKKNIFMKGGRKEVTDYLENINPRNFVAIVMSPLKESLPIWKSENERSPDFNELNRHMILHGESLNYGTKTNSLKAISFINYVVIVFRDGMV